MLVADGAGVCRRHARVGAVRDKAAAERTYQAEQESKQMRPGVGRVLHVGRDLRVAVRAGQARRLGPHRRGRDHGHHGRGGHGPGVAGRGVAGVGFSWREKNTKTN